MADSDSEGRIPTHAGCNTALIPSHLIQSVVTLDPSFRNRTRPKNGALRMDDVDVASLLPSQSSSSLRSHGEKRIASGYSSNRLLLRRIPHPSVSMIQYYQELGPHDGICEEDCNAYGENSFPNKNDTINKQKHRGERVTMIATCLPPNSFDKSDPSGGRISLATVVDSSGSSCSESTQKIGGNKKLCRQVSVKYSSNIPQNEEVSSSNQNLFSVVSLALPYGITNHNPFSLLLAIDSKGVLHACTFRDATENSTAEEVENGYSFRLDECNFDQIPNEPNEIAETIKKSTTTMKVTSELKPKYPRLHLMNTLTARMERTTFPSIGSNNDAIQSSVHSEAVLTQNSTPKKRNGIRRGRKRKLITSEGSSTINKDTITNADAPSEPERNSNFGVYVVASNLNGIIPPSEARPVVMHLTSSIQTLHSSSKCDKSNKTFTTHKSNTTKNSIHWTGRAWSEIPGLERVHCPITSILFTSRSKCGPEAWARIISAIHEAKRSSGETPPSEFISSSLNSDIVAENGSHTKTNGEGVVLMGFQDGSLMASLINNNSSPSKDYKLVQRYNHDLDVAPAVTIFRMPGNEPIISIQQISLTIDGGHEDSEQSQTPSFILCTGALGTIVRMTSSKPLHSSLKLSETFEVEHRLIPCESRLVSMGCLALHFPDYEVGENGVIATEMTSEFVQSARISLIATDDLGRTTLHSFRFYHGKPLRSLRLPQFGGISSSIAPLPSDVSAKSVLVLLVRKSKISVLAIPSPFTIFERDKDQRIVEHNSDILAYRLRGVGLIHALLPKLSKMSCLAIDSERNANAIRNRTSECKSSKLGELLDKIDSFDSNEKVSSSHVDDMTSLAIREVRDSLKAFSFLSDSLLATATIQDHSRRTDHLQCHRLRFNFSMKDLQFLSQATNSYQLSLHLLQSRSTSLSDFLRPESAKSTHPICYRSTSRDDRRFTKVLYGGTSTSVFGSNWKNGERFFSNPVIVDISVYDLLPMTCFASFANIYTYANSKDQNCCSHHIWCQSAKLQGDVGHEAGSPVRVEIVEAKRLHHCGITSCCGEQILGVVLPFHVSTADNNEIPLTHDVLSNSNHEIPLTHDILSISRGSSLSDHNHSSDPSARTSAERAVYKYYNSHYLQSKSSEDFVLPVFREELLIQHLSHPSGRGKIDKKAIAVAMCCSNSLQVLNAQQLHQTVLVGRETPERLVNLGNGPLVLTFVPSQDNAPVGEFGFAVASGCSTPNETLSLLPLVRQCFIRRILQIRADARIPHVRHDEMKLLALYHNLLTKKHTLKVAKHVAKSSEDLIPRSSDASKTGFSDDACFESILARSLSLYQALRSLSVVLT